MIKIPMSSPDLTAQEIVAVNRVLASTYLSIGPEIEAFERAFASYLGSSQAVAVSSGTSGLHLCVIAAGIGEGDLVITTPFSFVASANVILYERAVPIFVDIEAATHNIDPNLIMEAMADLERGGPEGARWLPRNLRNGGQTLAGGRVRAIMPVHVFGQPADLDPIVTTARRYGVAILEDACEALGAEYKGRKAGSLGDAAVFAFYPNKQMTTGEGGMIVTGRDDWGSLFRSLRNQGRDIFDAWLNHSRLGYNYRLTEMSAALGRVQIDRIAELLAKRGQVARWYNERLRNVGDVHIPYIGQTTTRMSWFVYVIRLTAGLDRDAVMAALEDDGIPSRPYFTPIHLQRFYRERFGYREGDFPVTEAVARSTLALPFSGMMTEGQVEHVCERLARAVRRHRRRERQPG